MTFKSKRRSSWKTVAAGIGGLLVLCCGGTAVIGTFADDAPTKSAAAQIVDQVRTEPAASEATAVPAKPAKRTATPAPTRTRMTTKPAVEPPTKPAVKPTTSKPAPKPTTKKPKPQPTTEEPESVYYKNCTAVRAAGAAPIHRGEPGYAKHLDRDGDGVGCE